MNVYKKIKTLWQSVSDLNVAHKVTKFIFHLENSNCFRQCRKSWWDVSRHKIII